MWRRFVGALSILGWLASSTLAVAWTPPQWRLKSPNLGGRIDAIATSPGNPSSIFIGSPGGGVWTTGDAGGTWNELNSGLGDLNVVHLEWDRLHPGSILYAQTYSDIYSVDVANGTWTNLTNSGFGGAGAPPLMPLWHIRDPRPFTQIYEGGGRGSS